MRPCPLQPGWPGRSLGHRREVWSFSRRTFRLGSDPLMVEDVQNALHHGDCAIGPGQQEPHFWCPLAGASLHCSHQRILQVEQDSETCDALVCRRLQGPAPSAGRPSGTMGARRAGDLQLYFVDPARRSDPTPADAGWPCLRLPLGLADML